MRINSTVSYRIRIHYQQNVSTNNFRLCHSYGLCNVKFCCLSGLVICTGFVTPCTCSFYTLLNVCTQHLPSGVIMCVIVFCRYFHVC